MTTDNTQPELDDRQHIKFNILVPFLTAITIKRQKEKGSRIKDTETAYYDFAVDLITAYTNKQIEAVLDRVQGKQRAWVEDNPGSKVANAMPLLSIIEAERNKLKGGK